MHTISKSARGRVEKGNSSPGALDTPGWRSFHGFSIPHSVAVIYSLGGEIRLELRASERASEIRHLNYPSRLPTRTHREDYDDDEEDVEDGQKEEEYFIP